MNLMPMRYVMKIDEGQIGKEQEVKKKASTFDGVVCTSSGSDIMPVFKRVYDKETDTSVVKQVDKFNIFEFIQASKSQTDLAILEKRYIELGEIPAVDPTMTQKDFVGYPENIHEVYALVNDVEGNFGKLPQSIQEIFGTKEAYLKSLMDGTYQATLINALNNAKPQAENKAVESEGN